MALQIARESANTPHLASSELRFDTAAAYSGCIGAKSTGPRSVLARPSERKDEERATWGFWYCGASSCTRMRCSQPPPLPAKAMSSCERSSLVVGRPAKAQPSRENACGGCAQECSSFRAGKHKRFGRSLVAGAYGLGGMNLVVQWQNGTRECFIDQRIQQKRISTLIRF